MTHMRSQCIRRSRRAGGVWERGGQNAFSIAHP